MGGGILWEKIYKWRRIRVATEKIGYYDKEIPKEDMKTRYPKYVHFAFIKTDYGNYEALGYYPIDYGGVIEDKNKNSYPIEGILDGYYYQIID